MAKAKVAEEKALAKATADKAALIKKVAAPKKAVKGAAGKKVEDTSVKNGKKGAVKEPPVVEKTKATRPKPTMSPYMYFMKESWTSSKEANPDLKFIEIAKINSDAWKSVTDKQKVKYQKMTDIDRIRYEKEMK